MTEELVFQKYTEAVCGYQKLSRWADILKSGEDFKSSVMINLLAANYWASNGDASKACYWVHEAAKRKPKNKIETLYQRAFECFIIKSDFAEAAKWFRQILDITPLDMFAMKRAQLTSIFWGDIKSMLAVAQLNDNKVLKTLPFYHGMLGFALQENGELKEAEKICEEGLKLYPNDAYIHHCLAHIWYFEGRIDDGLKRLLGFSKYWNDIMVFFRYHLWWHIALLYLDKHDYNLALKVMRDHCWEDDCKEVADPEHLNSWIYPPTNEAGSSSVESVRNSPMNKFTKIQIGVLGFIWKLELYSETSQDELYKEVVPVIIKKDPAPGYLLFDLLYLQALLRVGKTDEAENFFKKIGKAVIQPYARGLIELANGEPKGLMLLDEGLKNVGEFMASVEQSLIFHEHYVCECIRLGETERAKKWLEKLFKLRDSETWRRWRASLERK